MADETVTITTSNVVDAAITAAIANKSFGMKDAGFTAAYVDWFYGSAFGGMTTVVDATFDGRKIGQAAILWHPMQIAGKERVCANLVDLFVEPEHRSYATTRRIFAELKTQLAARHDCPVVTVPNPKAAPLNQRFLKLIPREKLDIRLGLFLPRFERSTIATQWYGGTSEGETSKEFIEFPIDQSGTQIRWTPRTLVTRLSHPHQRYALHKGENLIVVTAARQLRRIRVVLICAMFAKDNIYPSTKELAQVLGHASRCHRWPLFLYVGLNQRVPPPGWCLPDRFRPSPMQLYASRNLENEKVSRFESIDFDFA